MRIVQVGGPLVIRLPGGRLGGTVSDCWIQHHDLAATLLDLAHVSAPQWPDGRSVAPTVTDGAPAVRDHVVTGWGHGIVVATSEWWLSIEANGKGALLYPIDQADDPTAKSVAEDRPDATGVVPGSHSAWGAFITRDPNCLLDLVA